MAKPQQRKIERQQDDNQPMGFDPDDQVEDLPAEETQPNLAEKKPARARQGAGDRPTCQVCGTPMVAISTPPPGVFTWYGCPNRQKCGGSNRKVARPLASAAIRKHNARKSRESDISAR